MHGNGTLPLVGIQCFCMTDLAKAMDKEELQMAVSCTGQKVAEGINSIESELTSYKSVCSAFLSWQKRIYFTLIKKVTAMFQFSPIYLVH